MTNLSRRNFLKIVSSGAAAATAGSCFPLFFVDNAHAATASDLKVVHRHKLFPVLMGLALLSSNPFINLVAAQSAFNFIEVSTPQGNIFCAMIKGVWVPGDIIPDKKFSPFSSQKKKLDSQIKKGRFKKLTALKKKLNTVKRKMSAGKKACSAANPLPSRTATPLASSTSTPSGLPTFGPSATPTSRTGCYDTQRTTSCFGIPSGLRGRESDGQTLFTAACSGCHSGSADGGRRNRSYGDISNALSTVAEMRPYANNFSNQDLANIVAYSNRYNPNQ